MELIARTLSVSFALGMLVSGRLLFAQEEQHPGAALAAGMSQSEPAAAALPKCALHGGAVVKTKAHSFEIVPAPDGIRVYLYDQDGSPMLADATAGTMTFAVGDSSKREIALSPRTPGAGKAAVYFCTMHPDFVRDAPGRCDECGMSLVPQSCLFATTDFMAGRSRTIETTFAIRGLAGEEEEATFTRTWPAKPARAPGPHGKGSAKKVA